VRTVRGKGRQAVRVTRANSEGRAA
jgi:hypothetical protein